MHNEAIYKSQSNKRKRIPLWDHSLLRSYRKENPTEKQVSWETCERPTIKSSFSKETTDIYPWKGTLLWRVPSPLKNYKRVKTWSAA